MIPWTTAHQDPLCPWDFSGKNTGGGCHFLLQGNLPDPGIKPRYGLATERSKVSARLPGTRPVLWLAGPPRRRNILSTGFFPPRPAAALESQFPPARGTRRFCEAWTRSLARPWQRRFKQARLLPTAERINIFFFPLH